MMEQLDDPQKLPDKFECKECGKTFSRLCSLQKHESIHYNTPIHNCKYCISTPEHIQDTQKIDESAPTYSCHICGMVFLSTKDLKFHEVTHQNPHANVNPSPNTIQNTISNPNVQQTIVSKTFTLAIPTATGEETYIIAPKAQIPIDLPYSCSYCPKSFRSRQRCKVHERIHTGEKPYQCPYCEKFFAHNLNFTMHKRRHTGEKPYTCHVCQKGFVGKQPLQSHERVHTGEKPYTCRFCGRKFANFSPKLVHERTHTGEKPYACRFCEKCFAQSSAKKTHEKIHLKNLTCNEVDALRFVQVESRRVQSVQNVQIVHTEQKQELSENVVVDQRDGGPRRVGIELWTEKEHEKLMPGRDMVNMFNQLVKAEPRYDEELLSSFPGEPHTTHEDFLTHLDMITGVRLKTNEAKKVVDQ